MKNKTLITYAVLIAVVFGGILAARYYSETAPGQYDELAQCINESGATFYGAFWCPHCNDQKRQFGASQRYLPYLECSTPDGQNQTQECREAGIQSYPTWELADGTRLQGVQSPQQLAEATDCALPSESNS